MEKDVLVTLGGVLAAGGDEDNIDVVFPGQYYYRNERHFVLYEEVMEDFDQPTSNMIRFSPEEVSVRKRGVINTEMIFRPEEKTACDYVTPYGTISMLINTDRIRIQETEERIALWIDYSIEAGEDQVSRNYMRILIQPRANDFSLR